MAAASGNGFDEGAGGLKQHLQFLADFHKSQTSSESPNGLPTTAGQYIAVHCESQRLGASRVPPAATSDRANEAIPGGQKLALGTAAKPLSQICVKF